jgi:hypothetical protein
VVHPAGQGARALATGDPVAGGRARDSTADQARLRDAVARKLADTRRRIDQFQTLERELEALDEHLRRGKVWCGRIGDCGCWLPTREEVTRMATDDQTNGGCGDGCDCGCDDECCGGDCDCC